MSKIIATEILDLKEIDSALKTIDKALNSETFTLYLEKNQQELDEAYETESQNASEAEEQPEGFEIWALRRFVSESLKQIADMKEYVKKNPPK